MPQIEQETKRNSPDELDMPLPSDPKVIFLGGLFAFALLVTAYVAKEIILPIVAAFVLKLLLQPAIRFLEGWRMPRILAALLVIVVVFGTIVGLGTAISGPAGTWAAKLPEGVPRLQERLSFLKGPIDTLRQFLQQAETYTEWETSPTPATNNQGPTFSETLFTGSLSFATGLFTMVLLLFFLLISGDTFLRRLVEVLPRFSDKRQAVDISQQIEGDISAYLVTITIMNAVVGIVTGTVMWFTGLGDPVLWGAVAFLLNFLPILGPLVGVVVFLLAGLLTIDTLWQALLPAGLYLAIHLIEGEMVTPMLLAKRFTLNPVLVIVALVFWYWMWGVPGAILAVPLLAITKIVCDRIRSLAAVGHFLEG
jgi:predicted PurR-regulated permease PerM